MMHTDFGNIWDVWICGKREEKERKRKRLAGIDVCSMSSITICFLSTFAGLEGYKLLGIDEQLVSDITAMGSHA